MTIRRLDNVGIVVDDLDAAIAFFTELGMELEGRMPIEAPWADRVVGLRPRIKTLFMSGYADSTTPEQNAGGLPLLPKPFRLEELLARVREVLGLSPHVPPA